MTIATTIGSAIGTSGAYVKHAALRTATGSGSFVADVYASAVAGYAAKDAELAERRAEIAAAREAGPALVAPKRGAKRVGVAARA